MCTPSSAEVCHGMLPMTDFAEAHKAARPLCYQPFYLSGGLGRNSHVGIREERIAHATMLPFKIMLVP